MFAGKKKIPKLISFPFFFSFSLLLDLLLSLFISSSHSCSICSFTLSITNLTLRGPVWNEKSLDPAPLCPYFSLYAPCNPCLCCLSWVQLTASVWKEIPSHNRLGGIWHPIIQTEYNVISPMGSAERNEFPLNVMYEAASAISVCWASCFIPSSPANL